MRKLNRENSGIVPEYRITANDNRDDQEITLYDLFMLILLFPLVLFKCAKSLPKQERKEVAIILLIVTMIPVLVVLLVLLNSTTQK